MQLPSYEEDPSFYTDWADTREYTLGDIGVGECAGEVVSLFDMEIAKAESKHFDALLALDEHAYAKADDLAYRAMLSAARALVRIQDFSLPDEPNKIVEAFKTRFYDTQLFFDQYAGGKFAQYLFARHEETPTSATEDSARNLIAEAQL